MGTQPIWRTKQEKFSLPGIEIYSHVNKSYCSVLQIGCIPKDVQGVYTIKLRLTATKASKVWFSYSHNCTLANGIVFHSVCQVWLSSCPPEFSLLATAPDCETGLHRACCNWGNVPRVLTSKNRRNIIKFALESYKILWKALTVIEHYKGGWVAWIVDHRVVNNLWPAGILRRGHNHWRVALRVLSH